MKELRIEDFISDPRVQAQLVAGYVVLGVFVRDQETRFQVKCPAGHEYEVARWRFCKGIRCGSCFGKNKTATFEGLKKTIVAEGWEVLSKTYRDQYQKLRLKNPAGEVHSISADSWKRGYRSERGPVEQVRNRSIEEVRADFAKEGYQLKDKNFVNVRTKMDVVCPKGHKFKIHWNHWKDVGVRCGICHGTPRLSIEEIQALPEVQAAGYRVISRNALGDRLGVDFICLKNHSWSVSLPDFISRGYRCPTCNPHSSRAELDLLEEVKKIYPTAAKTKEFGFEIDIYIPERKLGIEYCGLYWHCDAQKPNRYHQEKFLKAKAVGVQLLTVFEDEWLQRRELVLSRILRSKKINARDTRFKELSPEEMQTFCSEFHLQGAPRDSTYRFGLEHEGSLVGVMVFGKHHRQGLGDVLVLSRLCFGQYDVRGGSEKLFKNSLLRLPKKKIVSWSDNRYSWGGVYQRLGFELEEELPPDYSYCKTGPSPIRVSKQSMKKTEAEKLQGLTEHALRKEQGWYRIYDCGKIRWVYTP